MSKNKVYIRKLRLAVYRTSLWVVISPSIRASIDKVEDEINESFGFPEDWKRSVYTFAYSYKDNGAIRYLLFLRPNAKPGEVAHETKHILNMVFGWNGVKLTTANDEHECYYLEYLINKVYDVINYYKKRVSSKHESIHRKPCNNTPGEDKEHTDGVRIPDSMDLPNLNDISSCIPSS